MRRWLEPLALRWRYRSAVCESCGQPADAVLSDGSTWCSPCHGAAIQNGYDLDFGHLIPR